MEPELFESVAPIRAEMLMTAEDIAVERVLAEDRESSACEEALIDAALEQLSA